MTKRFDEDRLQDILSHASEALDYCRNLSEEDFLDDRKTRRAVTYLIQVIGEASNRLSEETKSNIDLPWPDIIGMRNILVHAYHGVDDKILWNSVKSELPNLIAKISSSIDNSK